MVSNLVKINKLFTIGKGNSPSFEEYYDLVDSEFQTVAYVSASTTRNGINGFVLPKQSDIVFKKNLITVALQGQGSVSYATVQPHRFIASKLVLVLTPNIDSFKDYGIISEEEAENYITSGSISIDKLAIFCAFIRKYRWRFSYGRTVDEERLGELKIDIDIVKQYLLNFNIPKVTTTI